MQEGHEEEGETGVEGAGEGKREKEWEQDMSPIYPMSHIAKPS